MAFCGDSEEEKEEPDKSADQNPLPESPHQEQPLQDETKTNDSEDISASKE
jgi:hypothetical protein